MQSHPKLLHKAVVRTEWRDENGVNGCGSHWRGSWGISEVSQQTAFRPRSGLSGLTASLPCPSSAVSPAWLYPFIRPELCIPLPIEPYIALLFSCIVILADLFAVSFLIQGTGLSLFLRAWEASLCQIKLWATTDCFALVQL